MIEFNVQAMSCGHCASVIQQTVKAVDAHARVDVDLASKKVKVESAASREALARALTEAGYPPA
jgi:copper chaperone